MVNLRDIAGKAEEEGEPQRYSWVCRRRRTRRTRRRKRRSTPEIKLGTYKKKKQDPRDIAGNAEEEEGDLLSPCL